MCCLPPLTHLSHTLTRRIPLRHRCSEAARRLAPGPDPTIVGGSEISGKQAASALRFAGWGAHDAEQCVLCFLSRSHRGGIVCDLSSACQTSAFGRGVLTHGDPKRAPSVEFSALVHGPLAFVHACRACFSCIVQKSDPMRVSSMNVARGVISGACGTL